MPDNTGHMTHEEYLESSHSRLLQLCNDVVNRSVNSLHACSDISDIVRALGLFEEELFHPLIGIDSHADVFRWIDHKLEPWSEELLKSPSVTQYESSCRLQIEDACRDILTRYEDLWHKPTTQN